MACPGPGPGLDPGLDLGPGPDQTGRLVVLQRVFVEGRNVAQRCVEWCPPLGPAPAVRGTGASNKAGKAKQSG